MEIRRGRFLVSVALVWAVFCCSCSSSKDTQTKAENQPGVSGSEVVYSERPAAWYEAAFGAARVSGDGKWALYPSYERGTRLINLETGREDAERLAAGMDRVSIAAFYMGGELARRGERDGRQGWFLPGPDGPRLSSVPPDAIPQWSPDGSRVAYVPFQRPEGCLFVGDDQNQEQYSVEGRVGGMTWSPDSRLVYVTLWREDGLTSLARIDPETATTETLAKGLDARRGLNSLGISDDGKSLYLALASPAAPVAEARHQPDADRDLDIYKMDLATGALRVVVDAPGDDFDPYVAAGRLYWTHNDIKDSVVVFPSSGGESRVVMDGAELPYWSPDGKQIAFTYGGWRLADWALNLDAGVVDVDSQGHRQSDMKPIVTGYHEDFTPAWSPDGKWLAYHSHRSPTPVSSYGSPGSTDDLYLRRASAGESEEIRLTDFGYEVGVGDWSPDGRRLALDSWTRDGRVFESKPWIVTIDPSTGKPVRVERLPLPDPIKNSTWESWSPEGDEIAFEERGEGDARILWVVSADGKRAQKIAEYTSSTYGGLDWMPDGKTLVYGALAGKQLQIFAVPRSGGPASQLTNGSANLMHPQVSPDGRWIACTRMASAKEIWRLPLMPK